jgi:hypothetical protein
LCFPTSTPEVIARVEFDDLFFLPTPYEPGCGYAGFTAYTATGQRASQHQAYIATATTPGTISVPATWEGPLNDQGSAVLYFCGPPGVFIDPVEVTFTATVQGVTGTAVRAWTPRAPQEEKCDVVGSVAPLAYAPCKEGERTIGPEVGHLAALTDHAIFADITDEEDLDQVQLPNNSAGVGTHEVTVNGSSTAIPMRDHGSSSDSSHTYARFVDQVSCGEKDPGAGYVTGVSALWRPEQPLDNNHRYRIIDQWAYGDPANGHSIWVLGNSVQALYEGDNRDILQASPLGFDEYSTGPTYSLGVGYQGFGASASWQAGSGWSGGKVNEARDTQMSAWYKDWGSSTGKATRGETLWRIRRGVRASWDVGCGAAFD